MPLLRSSATTALELCLSDRISDVIAQKFYFEMGHRASPGEIRSWSASLPVLMNDLRDAGLGDIEVLAEYRLPLTSKRADVVLCGTNPKTSAPAYLVVELKQWSNVRVDVDDPRQVYIDAYGPRPVLHPADQVRGYVQYIEDFKQIFDQTQATIDGVAYLHNADRNQIGSLLSVEDAGKVFTQSDRGDWIKYLSANLSGNSASSSADILLNSATSPSKQLMSLAAEEIKEREQFVLLDEQMIAYRTILRAVENARSSDHKTVVVVTGGPGTGKSVIALSVLGELYREGRSAIHATGSRSFTKTMRKIAGHRDKRVQGLFKFFNSFMNEEKNSFDVLIADEAHRIRETSNNRYTKAVERTDKHQVDELIDIARVPVFLLDEHQVVRPGEIGTVADIQTAATRRGIDVKHISLDAQFRNGGSAVYTDWVISLLGLSEVEPFVWPGDETYDVLVAETPEELESFLATKNAKGENSRISAGYCWPWSDAIKGQPLVPDVTIEGWSRPWNNKEDRNHEGAPPTSLWATQDGGFGQVGCVYTAQGFEYSWSGVIIGPDLIWRDGQFVSDVTASRDPAFKGKFAAEFDDFVRHVYKVLLTRGLMGSVIYSTDAETRTALRQLVNQPAS